MAGIRFEFERRCRRLVPESTRLEAAPLIRALELFQRAWDQILRRHWIEVIDPAGNPLTDELTSDVEVEGYVPDQSAAETTVRETLGADRPLRRQDNPHGESDHIRTRTARGVTTMKRIDIDLGTTNSCVYYLDDTGQPVLVCGDRGQKFFPSAVWVAGPGKERVGGGKAKANMGMQPSPVIAAKRKKGTAEKVWLGGAQVDAVELPGR